MTIRSRLAVSVTVLFAAAAAAQAADDATPKAPAPAKSSDLSQYYGFGAMEILKLDWGIGRPILCDINGDTRNDIVFTNNRKARIELLLQKHGAPATQAEPDPTPVVAGDVDVNDRFGKEAAWRFKRVNYPLDVEANVLAVGDMNGDGSLDLVFYSKGKGLYVVLQDPPKKDERAASPDKPREPKWLNPTKIEIFDGQLNEGSLAIGDLNGDKRNDIALLANDGVYVVLQNPDGTMAKPVKYYYGGDRLRQVHIADLDGDGRNDLVVLSTDREKPVCVRYQSSTGQLGPELQYDLPIPISFLPCNLLSAKKACLVSVAAQSGRLRISALAPEAKKASYPVLSYPLPMGENVEGRDVIAADIDGDGLLDVVATDPAQAEFLLLRANAKTMLGEPKRFPGLMDMRKLCAARLGDDKGDAVVALSAKEKIIGISRFVDGRLTFPESVTIQGEPVAMGLCSLGGESGPTTTRPEAGGIRKSQPAPGKRIDLVYVVKDKEKYTLRTVLGVGTKDAKPGPELELTELKDKPLDIFCGDVAGDGRPAILIPRPYDPVLLVRQTAEGKFEQMTRTNAQSGLLANVFPNMMTIAPLGPKDSPAVLLAQKAFARSLVFDKDKGWKVLDQYEPADPKSVLAAAAACKLSPNATRPAIVTYDSARGRVCILTEQADKTYRPADEIPVGALTASRIVAGPFGGETASAILLRAAQKLVLLPVAAPTSALREVSSYEPAESATYGEIAIGDMNHKGRPDIVVTDNARGNIEILAFNSEGKLVPACKFKVFEMPRDMERPRYREGDDMGGGQPRTLLLGDVTGHGKTDVVLQVHDRIIIYPQE